MKNISICKLFSLVFALLFSVITLVSTVDALLQKSLALSARPGPYVVCSLYSLENNTFRCQLVLNGASNMGEISVALSQKDVLSLDFIGFNKNLPATGLVLEEKVESRDGFYYIKIGFFNSAKTSIGPNDFTMIEFLLTPTRTITPPLSYHISGFIEGGSYLKIKKEDISSELFRASDQEDISFRVDTTPPESFVISEESQASQHSGKTRNRRRLSSLPQEEAVDFQEEQPKQIVEEEIAQSLSSDFSHTESEIVSESFTQEKRCFDDEVAVMSSLEWDLICEAKNQGIIHGSPFGEQLFFYPDQAINRAEAVKVITLGVLKSLGYFIESDFDEELDKLLDFNDSSAPYVFYPDVGYDDQLQPIWFAIYVSLATRNQIVGGYPNGYFRPEQTLNSAEAYRVIVESAARANPIIQDLLKSARKKQYEHWFGAYVEVLTELGISVPDTYTKLLSRKQFVLLIMELLASVEFKQLS